MMKLHIAAMLASQGRHLSFHTPGHKRRGKDITELSYSDNLLSPAGVIKTAEEDCAKILGARKSYFLTDGSTCGIFSMLYALKAAGCKNVAVPTRSHRSVQNALEVFGLDMVPLKQVNRYGIPAQPTEEEIAAAMKKADALLLTSPDYYGYFAPLEAARRLCNEAGKPLIVDGAHGSHLHGTPMHAGEFADMWVDGLHKSLPALTQGAIVSAKSENWAALLGHGVRIFRTTSPSYPILASIEHAVKYPRNEKIEVLAEDIKRQVGALKNDDWTKIVVPFGKYADKAQHELEKGGIYPEFNDGNYLLFYLSPCTRAAHLKKLKRVLQRLPRDMVGGNAVQGRIPIYSEQ